MASEHDDRQNEMVEPAASGTEGPAPAPVPAEPQHEQPTPKPAPIDQTPEEPAPLEVTEPENLKAPAPQSEPVPETKAKEPPPEEPRQEQPPQSPVQLSAERVAWLTNEYTNVHSHIKWYVPTLLLILGVGASAVGVVVKFLAEDPRQAICSASDVAGGWVVIAVLWGLLLGAILLLRGQALRLLGHRDQTIKRAVELERLLYAHHHGLPPLVESDIGEKVTWSDLGIFNMGSREWVRGRSSLERTVRHFGIVFGLAWCLGSLFFGWNFVKKDQVCAQPQVSATTSPAPAAGSKPKVPATGSPSPAAP